MDRPRRSPESATSALNCHSAGALRFRAEENQARRSRPGDKWLAPSGGHRRRVAARAKTFGRRILWVVATVATGEADPAVSRRNHILPGRSASGARPIRSGRSSRSGTNRTSLILAPASSDWLLFSAIYMEGRTREGKSREKHRTKTGNYGSGARKRTRISDLRCVKAAL